MQALLHCEERIKHHYMRLWNKRAHSKLALYHLEVKNLTFSQLQGAVPIYTGKRGKKGRKITHTYTTTLQYDFMYGTTHLGGCRRSLPCCIAEQSVHKMEDQVGVASEDSRKTSGGHASSLPQVAAQGMGCLEQGCVCVSTCIVCLRPLRRYSRYRVVIILQRLDDTKYGLWPVY